jgi:hypothetical protein
MSLPRTSFPRRALPCRAVYLIREYSKPITRVDWRQSKPLTTTYQLYNNTLVRDGLLMAYLLMNIIDTEWYYLSMRQKYNSIENMDNSINQLESLIKI